jgi:hypothetical protein
MSKSAGKKKRKQETVAKNGWYVNLEAPLDEESHLRRHCLYTYSTASKKYMMRMEFSDVKQAFTKKSNKPLLRVIN